ncbi:hypothetical protein [Porphyromonas sp.]|uniref:hypothetical protein n=1 Tax=Porphyromonas sp. TaxID=1924944 RepID=UPI003A8E2879
MPYEMEQKLILLPAHTGEDFTTESNNLLSMYFSAGWRIAQINGVVFQSKDYPVIFTTTPMYSAFILLERPKGYLENHQL